MKRREERDVREKKSDVEKTLEGFLTANDQRHAYMCASKHMCSAGLWTIGSWHTFEELGICER